MANNAVQMGVEEEVFDGPQLTVQIIILNTRVQYQLLPGCSIHVGKNAKFRGIILDQCYIADNHCTITYDDETNSIWLYNHDQHHGTAVNEKRYMSSSAGCRLKNHDIVGFGHKGCHLDTLLRIDIPERVRLKDLIRKYRRQYGERATEIIHTTLATEEANNISCMNVTFKLLDTFIKKAMDQSMINGEILDTAQQNLTRVMRESDEIRAECITLNSQNQHLRNRNANMSGQMRDLRKKFKKIFKRYIKCIICNRRLRMQVSMFSCGHLFCNWCTRNRGGAHANCPQCRSGNIINDEAQRYLRDINDLLGSARTYTNSSQ